MDLEGKNIYVADIETDGLLNNITKLHVLSCAYRTEDGSWKIISTNNRDKIQEFVGNPDNIILGHNFIPYDKPALERLNYEVNATIIDTLALSWYLQSERRLHGLESYGEDYGVPKTIIEDDEWKDLPYEKAEERCETDVKINVNLWTNQLALLRELYDNDDDHIWNVIKFANFKMENIRIQEENKVLIDIPQCKKNLEFLENIIEEKIVELKKIMPKVPIKSTKKKPKSLYKKGPKKPKRIFDKEGELTKAGEKWHRALEDKGLPTDYIGEDIPEILSSTGEKWLELMEQITDTNIDKNLLEEVTVITGHKEPNPNSSAQMKSYLFTKNWEPRIFTDGANGKVPQLRDDDKNLCKSIIKLIETVPELEFLNGLSVGMHRAGYLKAFLSMADEDGYVIAGFNGFAKTWRFKHKKPIVNLPGNTSEHGNLIRSVMIAPKGYVWANTDMSSLEDRTKQNAIYPYDPQYVETMNTKGYDPHLAIAIKADFMSQEEVNFFLWYKKKGKIEDCPEIYKEFTEEQKNREFIRLGDVRHAAKTLNYSATYGAGVAKISESTGMSMKEAKKLKNTYWELNWSVKKFAEDQITKEVDGKTWIYNPYSKLWLLLTSSHMAFSALNQNFGSKVFDTFLYFLMEEGIKPIFTMHDELSWYCKKGDEEKDKKIIRECVDKLNNCFNLPIKFDSEPEFAESYGGVH